MSFHSRNAWIELGTSEERRALRVIHTVPAREDAWLRHLYISASDGSDTWAWELSRPRGTVVLAGFGRVEFDFGDEGFLIPGAPGANLELDIAAGANRVKIRVIMVGIDRAAQSG